MYTAKQTYSENEIQLNYGVETNHLGNVLVTVSAKPILNDSSGVVNFRTADVMSISDYEPFGSTMQGRSWTTGWGSYRFAFNGKEKDDEIKGAGNSYDFGARIYDPRIGRWLSLDPLQKKYPGQSPYNFCANNPIIFIDPDGREIIPVVNSSYNGTSNPETARDLAGTSHKVNFSAKFNKTTKQYDIYASISIKYSSLFANSEAFELNNQGLYEETKIHEETHKDQIVAAIESPISISIGGVQYNDKMDVVFTKATENLEKTLINKYNKTYPDTKEGQMQKAKDQKSYKNEFIAGRKEILKQVESAVQSNIDNKMNGNCDEMENEANANVEKTLKAQGKEVQYTNGNKAIKLDDNSKLPSGN